MNSQPQVSVAVALFNENGKVLLGKRLSKLATNMYAFPGGHVEYNEDPRDAAIRETEEETGIVLNKQKLAFFGYENEIFPNEDKHYVVLLFVANVNSQTQIPKNLEPTKCEGWNWYNWNDLPQPLITGLQQLIDKKLDPRYLSAFIGME